MGGGMPIGAFVAPKEIMQSLTHQPVLGHITTFGGHPVSCAASLATIQILEQEKLVEQVHSKESYILSKIQDNPIIKNIRSVGLLLAIEFESAEINFKVIQHCIQNGVITDWFLFNDQSLRLAPPLTITFEELDNAMEKINLSIQQTAESLALPQDKEL
jgi:acetylornithine/succinyldiaminopimelate/putrescine aminotransferase